MVKLYYPPAALLPQGNRDYVELAGAKCLLAMDEEKNLIVLSNIFSELSWGEFWKEAAISDQIEKLTLKHEDADALYDTEILRERLIGAFRKIVNRKLLFFGIASFESNAFERDMEFLELDLADNDRLMNLYKAKRLHNAFPRLEKDGTVEIHFFGEAAAFFSLPNKKTFKEIASTIYPYEGSASGIVAVAQGAANFIILADDIFKEDEMVKHVDKKNLNQMFNLVDKKVLAAPISWFKIALGFESLNTIESFEEVSEDPELKAALDDYKSYLRHLITNREKNTHEKILDDDLGKPIDIYRLTEEQIEEDLDQIMHSMNKLNEMQIISKEISLLYRPPKILFSHGDVDRAAIGGSMGLLSIDVGKNINCIADLRDDITWASYLQEESLENDNVSQVNPENDSSNGSKGIDTDKSSNESFDSFDSFDSFESQEYFDLDNPMQLVSIYRKTLQDIMKGGELFLGTLELESNSFEFSLFPELDLEEEDLQKIQNYYHKTIRKGNFPQLQDGYIKIIWSGMGKEFFTNPDCFGILELAEKMTIDSAYDNSSASGVVCVDSESTYFYILTNSFISQDGFIDIATLNEMYHRIETTSMAPLCWFNIKIGISSLKAHPFWKNASQYTDLLFVMDNYQKYIDTLVKINESEKVYRIYDQ